MSEGVTPPQLGPNSAFCFVLFSLGFKSHQEATKMERLSERGSLRPAACRQQTSGPGRSWALQPALAPGPGPRSRRESAPPRGPARRFDSGASRATGARCPRPLPGRGRRCGRPPGAHAPALPPGSHRTAIVCAPGRVGLGGGAASCPARPARPSGRPRAAGLRPTSLAARGADRG